MTNKPKIKIIYDKLNEGARPKAIVGSSGYHINKNVRRIKLKPKVKS